MDTERLNKIKALGPHDYLGEANLRWLIQELERARELLVVAEHIAGEHEGAKYLSGTACGCGWEIAKKIEALRGQPKEGGE